MSAERQYEPELPTQRQMNVPSGLQRALSDLSQVSDNQELFLKEFCQFMTKLSNAESCSIYKASSEGVNYLAGFLSKSRFEGKSISELIAETSLSDNSSVTILDTESGRSLRLTLIDIEQSDIASKLCVVTESLNETPLASALAQERFDLAVTLMAQMLRQRSKTDNFLNDDLLDGLLSEVTIAGYLRKLVKCFSKKTPIGFLSIAHVTNGQIVPRHVACSDEVSSNHVPLIAQVMSESVEELGAGYYTKPVDTKTIAARKLTEITSGEISVISSLDSQYSGIIIYHEPNMTLELSSGDLQWLISGLKGIKKRSWKHRAGLAISKVPFVTNLPPALRLPALICALTAVMIIPVPKTIKAGAIIVPTQQQVISTPYTARLDTVLVEPGDTIVANETIIAKLDVSDLLAENDSLKAQYASHLTQWRAMKSSGSALEARISQLKAEELAAQIELIESKLSKSDIKSPMSGVLTGVNQKQNLGIELRQGDELFRVAARGSNRVEIEIPAQQFVGRKSPLTKATLRLDAFPSQRYNVALTEIYPLAEFQGQQNIVKAIGTVDVNGRQINAKVLAGMSGKIKIADQWQMLGAKIFAEPIRKVRIALAI